MSTDTTSRSPFGLVGWLAATFAVAFFGAQFTPGEWYALLTKPAWTPPNWLFGPVWTLLYAMMAVAAYLVWRRFGFAGGGGVALGLFLLQLVLNGLWSWFFFGLHWIGLAFLDILALWVAILATIIAFYRLHRIAAWLLIPYLLWVSYAAALNLALWRLN
ncbi:tryptophan-rich sensory protein [candidate division GN15 bacterium]|nr:tryptophan-rich sensory protein [candidate division GN15 bacterium]